MQLKLISFFWVVFLLILSTFSIFRDNDEGYASPLAVAEASTTSEAEKSSYSASPIIKNVPTRITIPRINVVSNIESVGTTKDGAMDIPKSAENVAWFESGVRPGEVGNAVISGHYGKKNNKISTFDYLHTLKKGDMVFIEDDNDNTIIFMVREVKRYPWKSKSDDVFISKDKKSHLNLITCEEVWDNESKSFSNRLVVFTDRIN